MANMFSTQGNLEAQSLAITTTLQLVGQELAHLEQEPLDRGAIETMYRSAHTIGRSASMMEWPALAQIAHGMEGILADALDGLARIDAPALGQLRESFTTMQNLIERLPSATLITGWPSTPTGTGSAPGGRVIESTIVEQQEQQPGRRTQQGHAPTALRMAARLFTGEKAGGARPAGLDPEPQPEASSPDPTSADQRGGEPQDSGASTALVRSLPGPRQQERSVDRSIALILSLQSKRSTGTLRLRRGNGATAEEGWIRFVDGQITEAQVGRRCGAEARNWLSTWIACRYTYEGRGPGP